jgi:hypothetical protein
MEKALALFEAKITAVRIDGAGVVYRADSPSRQSGPRTSQDGLTAGYGLTVWGEPSLATADTSMATGCLRIRPEWL